MLEIDQRKCLPIAVQLFRSVLQQKENCANNCNFLRALDQVLQS